MLARGFSLISSQTVGHVLESLRRATWFLDQITIRKLGNLFGSAACIVRKTERVDAWPLAVKIDISPLCNLRCTICVHAEANGNPLLEEQHFHGSQRMSLDQFRRIIDEISGKVSAVSLYYLGDPLVHPDLDAMCGIARAAGLNVHLSTNFSFNLSDERIRSLVGSGVTDMTVCVDGLSQQKYQMTRVGGRIDWVLSNLRRTMQYRAELRQSYPRVEVQYVKFRHNADEVEAARRHCLELGVDQFTEFRGSLGNYTDDDPVFQAVEQRPGKRFPLCMWPYISMVIKYNGDVVPCCKYRFARQYTRDSSPETTRVLGNVFATSVREVWNSPAYQQARRMVSDPPAADAESGAEESFCHGCPMLYKTHKVGGTIDVRTSRNAEWSDLYTLSVKGRPVRKPETVSWTPKAASE